MDKMHLFNVLCQEKGTTQKMQNKDNKITESKAGKANKNSKK